MKEKKARPHAELIKQWADDDSLVVEYKNNSLDEWQITTQPMWDDDFVYRIKPEVLRYRVGLYNYHDELRFLVRQNKEEFDLPLKFIKWITDWIEVEI